MCDVIINNYQLFYSYENLVQKPEKNWNVKKCPKKQFKNLHCRGRTYIQKCKNSILKYKSRFPMWTSQFGQIRMGDNTNLFALPESAIDAIKKPELVQKIIALKGKVIVDSDISNLCNQISKLNDTISQLHSTNEKIRSDLTVVNNVNAKLEE